MQIYLDSPKIGRSVSRHMPERVKFFMVSENAILNIDFWIIKEMTDPY